MKRIAGLIIASLMVQIIQGPVAMALEVTEPPVEETAVVVQQAPEPSLPLVSDHVQKATTQPPSAETTTTSQTMPPSPPLQPTVTQTLLPSTEEVPVTLPSLIINRVVASIAGSSDYEYIELYNPQPNDVTLDAWHLNLLRDAGKTTQELTLNGTVKAGGYVLIAGADSALEAFLPDFRLKSNSIVTTGGIVQLVNTTGGVIDQLQWGDTATPSLALTTGTMLDRRYTDDIPSLTGDTTQDFVSAQASQSPRSGGYIPAVESVNHCEGIMISEIAANTSDDQQFIELYNNSAESVTLDDCLLQTNRSATKSYLLTGTLNAGQYQAVYLTNTDLELTKTTSGTAYVLSSDGKEEVTSQSYNKLATDTSWSWFVGNDWRQTFLPSPNGANTWQEFMPCESGYERNVDTGRCRKIETTEVAGECEEGKYRNPDTGRCRAVEPPDSLTPCKPGQTRSSETNRCRAVATVAGLTPCKEGQTRNPETNRCRSVATTASALVPCKEGQERNPATNRCRNVTKAIPAAAFATDPTKNNPTVFVGWWAIAGVVALAAGYGIWEWRREIVGGLQTFGSLFSVRK